MGLVRVLDGDSGYVAREKINNGFSKADSNKVDLTLIDAKILVNKDDIVVNKSAINTNTNDIADLNIEVAENSNKLNNLHSTNETYIHFSNALGSFVGSFFAPKSGVLSCNLDNKINGSVACVYYKDATLQLQGEKFGLVNNLQFTPNEVVLVWFIYDQGADLVHVNVMQGDSNLILSNELPMDLPFDL